MDKQPPDNSLSTAKRAEPSQDQLRVLIGLYQSGQLEPAVILAERLCAEHPGSASVFNVAGLIAAALQREQEAIAYFRKAIRLKPSVIEVHKNLGTLLLKQGDLQGAADVFVKLIQLLPDSPDMRFNLAAIRQSQGQLDAAREGFQEALRLDPGIVDAHINLGRIAVAQGDFPAAVASYSRALELQPHFAEVHNNLGIALYRAGKLDAAIMSFRKAIELKPDLVEAHNSLGNALTDKADLAAAEVSYKQALQLSPAFTNALWNLFGIAADKQQALSRLEACVAVDADHQHARMMLAGIKASEGDSAEYEALVQSGQKSHAIMRSFAWLLRLPEQPAAYYNRWAFFDAIIEASDQTRPFYEFGVWQGASFRYLIRTFGSGFGFDTFQGLPEDWHKQKSGSYSSAGNVPDIAGGEFIVGDFAKSLPGFFAVERPMASVINFDADLYSSTLCALRHARSVIDDKTILIFDEFLMNENWEQDEFRALNEYCEREGLRYEVLAVCYFSKQVAVLLRQAD